MAISFEQTQSRSRLPLAVVLSLLTFELAEV